jgi:hypothetical protein
MQVRTTTLRLFIAAAAAALAAGCATTRSTIDVAPAAGVAAAAPPAAKAYVTITRVTDARVFEAAPSNPSIPSLQSAEDLKNPAIKARAVARKRGGFGTAMADILLPEGRTVEQLVREGATRALVEKGYGVVDAASAAKMNARPLELEIKQYWTWFSPGFWAIKLEFEGIVVMKGDMLIGGAELMVRGYTLVEAMAATDAQWQKTMEGGAADLAGKMKAGLRDP